MHSLARHTFWVLGLTTMVTSMVLVGCGSNDGGGGGVPAPGVAVTTVACPIRQVATAFGCLQTDSCQNDFPGYGFLPGENRCVPPIAGASAGTTGKFVGTLNVNGVAGSGRKTFELLLSNMGFCSRPVSINIGFQDCASYSSTGYISLETPGASGATLPATASVVIGAGAPWPGQPNRSAWTPNVLTIPFTSNLAYANANNGFTGTGANGLRFVVNKGFPGNSYQMDVSVMYNGITFATGTVYMQ